MIYDLLKIPKMDDLFELRLQRLPRTVIPLHYNLQLKPFLDHNTFHFEGQESILVTVVEPVKTIILNSVELHIRGVKLQTDKQELVPTVTYNDFEEIIMLEFQEDLPTGRSNLIFDYSGLLNEKPKGFYRSRYTNFDGKPAYAALTHFEPSDARRCFPCWDEPAFKATFTVILMVPQGYTGISNMTVKLGVKQGDYRCIEFDPTPPMSTYLLAAVIGEYDYVQSLSNDGVRIRVYTPLGRKEFGRYALNVATKVLPFFRDFFDMKYPLPKLDLVAVPDLPSGACESWGLMTFRDSALLLEHESAASWTTRQWLALLVLDLVAVPDLPSGACESWGLMTFRDSALLLEHESAASWTTRQWLALLVVHETALQWFGNAVTASWWTEQWLYEGVAQYLEFVCVQQVFPSFNVSSQFLTDTTWRALDADALRGALPLMTTSRQERRHQRRQPDGDEDDVSVADEADEMMTGLDDAGCDHELRQDKAAALMRALHAYVGDGNFRRGINLFLTRHKFGTAGSAEFWDALESVSHLPVSEVMTTWTLQSGYPLLRVFEVQQGSARTVTLTQERFYADGAQDVRNKMWLIPVTISTSKNPNKVAHSVLMDRCTLEVHLNNVSRNDWIKVNPGCTGYYRCLYSPYAVKQFESAIRDARLPPNDRLGLLDDMLAASRAGLIDTGHLLRFLEYYSDECNGAVLHGVSLCVARLHDLVSYTHLRAEFNAFARRLFSTCCGLAAAMAETHQAGNKEDGPEESDGLWELAAGPLDDPAKEGPAALVLAQLVKYDDEPTIREAKIRFLKHISGKRQLPSELRASCLRAVLRDADSDTYEQVLRLCKQAAFPAESTSVLLGRTGNKMASDADPTSGLLPQLPEHEERMRILRALGALRDDALLARALQFGISESVQPQEGVIVIASIAATRRGRDMAWKFFQYKYPVFLERYQGSPLGPALVRSLLERFCTEEKANKIREYFTQHPLPGCARTIAMCLEKIRCNSLWLHRDIGSISEYLTEKFPYGSSFEMHTIKVSEDKLHLRDAKSKELADDQQPTKLRRNDGPMTVDSATSDKAQVFGTNVSIVRGKKLPGTKPAEYTKIENEPLKVIRAKNSSTSSKIESSGTSDGIYFT